VAVGRVILFSTYNQVVAALQTRV